MKIEELSYILAPENIEGTPREVRVGRRDFGRLMVVKKSANEFIDSYVRELPNILKSGDLLVLNNSKRIPGVLKGRTKLGGKIELRFVDLDKNNTGLCRVFPMHDISPGSLVFLDDGGSIKIIEMGVTKYNLARVEAVNETLKSQLINQGTPILGFFYDNLWETHNLNPHYASEEGSVESPLAGLHFTPELLSNLEAAGIEIAYITLHSVGSWLPFMEETADEHVMWEEEFYVSEPAVEAINRTRKNGGRIVACGSTSLRALESATIRRKVVKPTSGRTSLYIMPGYEFSVVDIFFTNFHQYQTSLMVLDCAFAGKEITLQAYHEASKREYKFYEFGDAVIYM